MTSEKISSVAFLIDADNLSQVAIEEAFDNFDLAGTFISVKRAYGGLEKLASVKDVVRKRAVSALVNQGKGTTDVALVVDVMDLLHRAALPAAVAIGSSDADFAPLAVRLREAGIRVLCFAELPKADAIALARAYDQVFYVGAAVQIEPAPEKDLQVKIDKLAFPTTLAKPIPLVVAKTIQPLEDPAAVRLILAEIPGWLPNTVRQLNQLGKPLRESGVKKGNKPLHELFGKHPTFFKILPINGAAKQIRLLKNP